MNIPFLNKNRPVNEVIQEIHDTFYTEVDRLLEYAKIMRPEDTTMQGLIDKSARLKNLGFGKTKECIEADKEIARLNEIKKRNESNKALAKAISYFQHKYPLYKFITEDSVRKICAKYNLIYGPVDRYTGTVPEKNIQDMERFAIGQEDICCFKEVRTIHGTSLMRRFSSYDNMTSDHEKSYLSSRNFLEVCERCPLEIAAPASDFDTTGMELKNFKLSPIEIPDPIVLQPVFFEGSKHYLIVTAWGLEASDEMIVNEKMN
jgi:hypothetical protein